MMPSELKPIFRVVVLLLLSILFVGCPPPTMMLLSDKPREPEKQMSITYDGRYHTCLFIYTVDELNEVFKSGDFEKARIILEDGRKYSGTNVRIDGNELLFIDLDGVSQVIGLSRVEKMYLDRTRTEDRFHLPICPSVPILNMFNEEVRNKLD